MNKMRKPRIAICYDFDGTLSPGNMQEYKFVPLTGKNTKEFWGKINEQARKQQADEILVYMHEMLREAEASRTIKITRKSFAEYGKKVELYDGVDSWFKRINKYSQKNGAIVEHYIISSGIREMIEGTSIYKEFKYVFASSYMYDQHGVAFAPGMAVNYTNKTQFLFRINKGCLDVCDKEKINRYVSNSKRRIPFERMIYIGDGMTDVPCMKVVKDQGGHSVAVYKPGASKQKAIELLKQDRVNFFAPADYGRGKLVEKQVERIIDKIIADFEVSRF